MKNTKWQTASKVLSVVLSIIFLWGVGVSLLVVLLNVFIGFADTDADFRAAFLRLVENGENSTLDEYIRVSEYQRLYGSSAGMLANLHTYETHYDPENTNLRFSVTDNDGHLLLTNDPLYGMDEELLVSNVRVTSFDLRTRSYRIQHKFENPLWDYQMIFNGNHAKLLEDPSDFRLWYFSDSDIDSAYHNGVVIRTNGSYVTDLLFFDSEEEAKSFNCVSIYGSNAELNILGDVATLMAQLDAETAEGETFGAESEGEEGTPETGAAKPETLHISREYLQGQPLNTVVAEVMIRTESGLTNIPLGDYYMQKEWGIGVTAQDETLEKKLNSPLEITISAEHTDSESCYVRTYLPAKLPVEDTIRTNYALFLALFKHSEWVVVLMFTFVAFTVVSCISMCTKAGHSPRYPTVHATQVHRLAYEIFWFMPSAAIAGAYLLMYTLMEKDVPYRTLAIFSVGMVGIIAALSVLLLYTTAVRAKTNTFWTSFLFVRAFGWFFSLFKHKTFTVIGITVHFVLLCILNYMPIFCNNYEFGIFLFATIMDILTLAAILYCVYSYFELHSHVTRMETGDFSPAKHGIPLALDFRRFDNSLNDITSSVEDMVARQTKAEHLRTELITNVSHDLKTPLTSICNYVDLLSREPMETEAAAEYLDVLRRQAARLKKLTVDLVDASKASTGNLTVELVPTDLQVLLGQLGGEYEEIMESKKLSLVVQIPEESVTILADGRQIWRVFDNLLNNACKYALSGTRVYLDMHREENQAVITLKNISASPLNISPEELMERFVRGDASRHTEGSGLGLSIARDLTNLQNGVLSLETDGDLFKAILKFPLYNSPEQPEPPAPPVQ